MPNDATQYLTIDEVLEIHSQLIEYFGGAAGIRDAGLLESALYRPQTGYYSNLLEEATALFESLIINHPFHDGNKRVAFFSTDIFLRLNGSRFQVDADTTYEFLIELLDNNNCDFEHLLPWIHQSVVSTR